MPRTDKNWRDQQREVADYRTRARRQAFVIALILTACGVVLINALRL